MQRAKRIWWPDEEPEVEWIPWDDWVAVVSGLCPLCGWEGHQGDRCPNVAPWMLRQP